MKERMRMHPRLVYGVPDKTHHLALPQHAGGVEVWAEKYPAFPMGEYEAIEYRTPAGLPIVVVRIAWDGARVLAAIAMPVPEEDEDDARLPDELVAIREAVVGTGVVEKQWVASKDLVVPDLEGDKESAASAAKALWPPAWRKRDPRDAGGDPKRGVPHAPPTGERSINVRLA